MTNAVKIIGDRIFLRPLVPDDVTQTYLNWLQDKKITQFLEPKKERYNLASLKKYIKAKDESMDDFLFGIFIKEGSEHIGNIKIGGMSQAHRSADLGILIGNKNVWGRGHGTEAIKLATGYAFNELGLNKLIADISGDNIGSYRAFIKAGYREVRRIERRVFCNGRYVEYSTLVEKCKVL